MNGILIHPRSSAEIPAPPIRSESPQHAFSEKMRLGLIGVLLVCALALGGCASLNPFAASSDEDEKPPEPDIPAEQLYNDGLIYLNSARYARAVNKFKEIDEQHPYSDWAQKGLLMQAFANYRRGSFSDAVSAAERFVSLYPSSEDAAYAQYLIGQSYSARIQDVTRDQTYARQTLDAMQTLIDQYPESEYVDEAQKKVRFATDQLAAKEMEIGRYYLNKRFYTGAIGRFHVVVTDYQSTRHIEEALMRLTECYLALGVSHEAEAAAAVLGHNFPDSPWYRDAYALLRSGGLQPREHSGSWISRNLKKIF